MGRKWRKQQPWSWSECYLTIPEIIQPKLNASIRPKIYSHPEYLMVTANISSFTPRKYINGVTVTVSCRKPSRCIMNIMGSEDVHGLIISECNVGSSFRLTLVRINSVNCNWRQHSCLPVELASFSSLLLVTSTIAPIRSSSLYSWPKTYSTWFQAPDLTHYPKLVLPQVKDRLDLNSHTACTVTFQFTEPVHYVASLNAVPSMDPRDVRMEWEGSPL